MRVAAGHPVDAVGAGGDGEGLGEAVDLAAALDLAGGGRAAGAALGLAGEEPAGGAVRGARSRWR